MAKITSFHGHYEFLSNFYTEPDRTCVEIDFQRSKTFNPSERFWFHPNISPGNAKRLGRRVTLRSDWEEVKVDIMEELVRQKFKDHPMLASQLISTHPHILIEGNNWGDQFWGQVNGVGRNVLGQILMRVRSEWTGQTILGQEQY